MRKKIMRNREGPESKGNLLPFGRRNVLLGAAALAAALWSAVPRVAPAQQPPIQQRPSIVFILMDNLGYGELGVYGGGITRGAPTPRIDRLAAEGTRLTNFNVEAQCTPSRSAIMTGRFPNALSFSIPANEPERVAALRALDILDTPPDIAYDEICELAAQVCQCPWHTSAF
jgi:hypothetical protein